VCNKIPDKIKYVLAYRPSSVMCMHCLGSTVLLYWCWLKLRLSTYLRHRIILFLKITWVGKFSSFWPVPSYSCYHQYPLFSFLHGSLPNMYLYFSCILMGWCTSACCYPVLGHSLCGSCWSIQVATLSESCGSWSFDVAECPVLFVVLSLVVLFLIFCALCRCTGEGQLYGDGIV
jgi:hypothetical protein